MSQLYVPESWQDAIEYYSEPDWEIEIKTHIQSHFQDFKCPGCGADWEDEAEKETRWYNQKRDTDTCKICRRNWNWRTGTIFHCSYLPLWKWCVAIWYVVNTPMPTTLELPKKIAVSRATSWRLINLIKEHLQSDEKFREWVFGERSWFRVYTGDYSLPDTTRICEDEFCQKPFTPATPHQWYCCAECTRRSLLRDRGRRRDGAKLIKSFEDRKQTSLRNRGIGDNGA